MGPLNRSLEKPTWNQPKEKRLVRLFLYNHKLFALKQTKAVDSRRSERCRLSSSRRAKFDDSQTDFEQEEKKKVERAMEVILLNTEKVFLYEC